MNHFLFNFNTMSSIEIHGFSLEYQGFSCMVVDQMVNSLLAKRDKVGYILQGWDHHSFRIILSLDAVHMPAFCSSGCLLYGYGCVYGKIQYRIISFSNALLQP